MVLALPDPQAARLVDREALPGVVAVLDRPDWTPQLALLAGWERRGWADDLDGAFVSGSDVLEWVADDGRRRGDSAPVLVAHSTPGYAAEHLEAPEEGLPALLAEVRRTLSVEAEPAWARVHRWSLASPGAPRSEPCGVVPVGPGLRAWWGSAATAGAGRRGWSRRFCRDGRSGRRWWRGCAEPACSWQGVAGPPGQQVRQRGRRRRHGPRAAGH